MNDLLSYYPVLVNLFKYLSHRELKSLSSVSKDWWEVTSPFLETISKLVVPNSSHKIQRNYNYIEINQDHIDIKDNSIGSLPGTVSKLCLTSDTTSPEVFDHLKKMKKLKHLTLTIDCVDVCVGDIGLETLHIKSPMILNFAIQNQNTLKKLHISNFFGCVGEADNCLRNFKSDVLEGFGLNGVLILFPNEGLNTFFSKHTLLKSCFLNYLSIQDDVIASLQQNCPLLETLSLKGCFNLSDHSLLEVSRMKKIKVLNILNTCVTFEGLRHLASTDLNSFKVSSNFDQAQDFNEPQVQEVIKDMGNLTVLVVKFNRFGDEDPYNAMQFVADHLPEMEELELSVFSAHFKDCPDSLPDLDFKNLVSLKLHYIGVTNTLLRSLRAPKLKFLTIKDTKKVNYLGFKDLAKNCPVLKHLDVSGGKKVDDDCIDICRRKMKNLENLNLSFCRKVTIESLRFLVTESKIYIVNMAGVVNNEDSRIDEIVEFTEGFTRINSDLISNGMRQIFI
ncbi:LRRC29 family protein [Megaselia abdita]